MRRPIVALLLAVQSVAALACGYCVEDKIAAAYDHSVVTRAVEHGHEVAFFALEGPMKTGVGPRRSIKTEVESIPGVDGGTARVSLESASLSFAYDPRRYGLGTILRALDARLKAQGLSASLLRTMK